MAFSLETGKSLNQSKLSNMHQIKNIQPSTTEVFLHRSDLFTTLLSSQEEVFCAYPCISVKKIISDVVVDVYFWLHIVVVVYFGFRVDVDVDGGLYADDDV